MARRVHIRALAGLIAGGALLALAPSAMATIVYRDAGGIHVEAGDGEDNWYSISHVDRHPTNCPGAPRGCFRVRELNPEPMADGERCFTAAGTSSVVLCKDPGGRMPIIVNARDEDDTMAGGDLSDIRPNDVFGIVRLGTGNDSGSLGPGDDRIYGGPGNESFAGGGNGLYGGGGDDVVEGGPGDDRLDGEGGADLVGGGITDTGIDSFFGGGGPDFLDTRDGLEDGTIDCGGGRDTARRDTGLDEQPESC
jgi:RTX calcium-binding nonapeptide repeat (4 copies)